MHCAFQDVALDRWSQYHEAPPHEGIDSFQQRSCDTPLVQAVYNQLLLSDAQSGYLRLFVSCVTERIMSGFKDGEQGY